ncbi:hypothetical protein GCM10010404_80870 [Nonomuraea africana]
METMESMLTAQAVEPLETVESTLSGGGTRNCAEGHAGQQAFFSEGSASLRDLVAGAVAAATINRNRRGPVCWQADRAPQVQPIRLLRLAG